MRKFLRDVVRACRFPRCDAALQFCVSTLRSYSRSAALLKTQFLNCYLWPSSCVVAGVRTFSQKCQFWYSPILDDSIPAIVYDQKAILIETSEPRYPTSQKFLFIKRFCLYVPAAFTYFLRCSHPWKFKNLSSSITHHDFRDPWHFHQNPQLRFELSVLFRRTLATLSAVF